MKTRTSLIIIFFIIAAFVFAAYFTSRQEEKLKNNHKTTWGHVTKIAKHPKQQYNLEYEFFIDSKKYTGTYSIVEYNNIFVNKNFPVIYNPADPEENEMLLFYEDFEKYSEVYPDSIRWATKYK